MCDSPFVKAQKEIMFKSPISKDKKQVNVRLTNRGIMLLNELSDYYGIPKNLIVEWLVALHHEKLQRWKGGETNETKGS